jgi:osmoprotectant transport system substrate-binding protein
MRALRALFSAALILLVACSSSGGAPTASAIANPRGAIVVASFDFAEGRLLSDLYATVLKKNDYRVRRAFNLGPREIVEPALLQGRVDLVPEYLGTALSFITLGKAQVTGRPPALHRQLVRAYKRKGVDPLAFAPAEDQNGIVVSEATAARYDLLTVSDLKRVAPKLVFGGPPECEHRPFCLPGLATTYGLHFKRFQPLDAGGPITVSALRSGQIDVALLFTTDPSIVANNFVLLGDDRNLQPADNIVPVIRREVLKQQGGGVVRLIDAVTRRLTTETLIKLNARVQLEGVPVHRVATDWLQHLRVIQ